MIETIIIAFIVCKIKGYKIKPLFKTWHVYPIVIVIALNGFVQANIFAENYEYIKYSSILKNLYLCSYLPLIFKYELYIGAIVGSVFVTLGGILNNIAIGANNGKMPVFPNLSYITGYVRPDSFSKVNDIHSLGNADTQLKFLTDIFDLGYSILSVGDIFIRVFVFLILFQSVKSINKTV
ncbi:DUF5317 family protein [Clostridium sp.]|uniref:DUF5317 family protein n=1 Tax=Clostridium sp. TaxID=1506 RepID=UPI003F3BA967